MGCLPALPDADLGGITAVLAKPSEFAQDAADPLGDTPAGTLVDPLDSLDGCWGAAFDVHDPADGPSLVAYSALRFDSQAGSLTRYTVNALGRAQVLDVWDGDYEVLDHGRLSFQVRRVRSNLPGFTQLTDVTDRFATLPSYEVRITRDGDRIKAVFVAPPEDPRTPAGVLENVPLVYRRFACQE
jgi:hypothetical protein